MKLSKNKDGVKVEKGLVHIYCGEGKGKTTAAFGLVLRAAGQGKRVLVCQLLKDGRSGEVLALGGLKGVEVVEGGDFTGFVDVKNEAALAEARASQGRKLRLVSEKMTRDNYDLVVVDELCTALFLGVIEKGQAEELLIKKPAQTELVFTGRNPAGWLLEAADYISDIRCVRHPYEKGVPARRGIEW